MITCPKHGIRYLFERRGIGVTQWFCDRCVWKSREMLTKIFKRAPIDREAAK